MVIVCLVIKYVFVTLLCALNSDFTYATNFNSQRELVGFLQRKGYIKSKIVINVMLGVDRRYFCPTRPYENQPQTIAEGVNISAPFIHGMVLEALTPRLEVEARVLCVGCSSGYLMACISLYFEKYYGSVTGVESKQEVTDLNKKNIRSWIASSDLAKSRRLKVDGHFYYLTYKNKLDEVLEGVYHVIYYNGDDRSFIDVLKKHLRYSGVLVYRKESEGGDQELYRIDHFKLNEFDERLVARISLVKPKEEKEDGKGREDLPTDHYVASVNKRQLVRLHRLQLVLSM
uniref:protein-L-isoaspartate(D-aspartate) O-methyltransferase n=1 Tax=Trichobilharzia regenti TaxID=157069 RepID=A0AA85IR41_TRIRE|nr:unnamed protein product [Trichobilharzia regenti]